MVVGTLLGKDRSLALVLGGGLVYQAFRATCGRGLSLNVLLGVKILYVLVQVQTLVLLHILRKFLSMAPDLGAISGFDVLFDFAPVFTVQTKS